VRPEQQPGGPFDENFQILRLMQQEFERLGYFFHPVPKEHTEAGVIDPLVHRIRGQIKRRGMEKVAGKVAITWSGYAQDDREIFAIPEIRAFYQRLDRQLPELPSLVTYLPQFNYNGPGFHLMLLGNRRRSDPPTRSRRLGRVGCRCAAHRG
jgi:hypothetical protein